jgi:hypothetical protein
MSEPTPAEPRPQDRAEPETASTDDAPEPETAPTDEASDPETRGQAVLRWAAAGAADVVDTVTGTLEALHELTGPVVRRAQRMTDAAVQQWRNREAARVRHLRSLNKEPLPNLFGVHTEARGASRHELGLTTIPVEEIRGTAVEGPEQRGRDFLPLPAFRSTNWAGRWHRMRLAVAQLVTLPPIDVLKAGGGYWVVDGHNRVAAALYAGQLDVDAVVIVLRLPGDVTDDPAGSLAPLHAEADEMRAAGMGSRMPPSPPAPDL